MILSHEQLVLVAQLVTKQTQPVECFVLVSTNAKTITFGQVFEKNNMLKITDDEVTLLPEFFDVAERNGIVEETGTLTEVGEKLSQETIQEKFQLFKVMLTYVS